MESCRGSLKTELVHHRRFVTREQARQEITEYIDIFYNRMRKQARLGNLSPAAFSQQYHAIRIAASPLDSLLANRPHRLCRWYLTGFIEVPL